MAAKRLILRRRRRNRPSKEAVEDARSTRRRTLYFFQGMLLWILVQIGVVMVYIKNDAAMPRLVLAGLLAVGLALGLLAGRRYRIPFLFIGAGTAMPGALLPPFLIGAATCFGVAALGYLGHLVTCWLEGQEVTAPLPREADAPSEVVRIQAERKIPGREDVKPVPDARLIPKMPRRWR